MPLLTCPICQEPMREVVRQGVAIDLCPRCGGVWLDRGELEKLLSIVREEAEAYEKEWEEYHKKEHRPPKKKRKLFDFFDLFD
ncbi:MAG: zf-TFIIB domain-containing protein [Thermaceae bacterium]